MILEFLTKLRESADIQYKVFTEGSCFKLYEIIKTVFPQAEAYWSDRDGHCITKVDGEFYDIGGKLSESYTEDMGYFRIPEDQLHGYSLMKWLNKDSCNTVKPEKYKVIQNEKNS